VPTWLNKGNEPEERSHRHQQIRSFNPVQVLERRFRGVQARCGAATQLGQLLGERAPPSLSAGRPDLAAQTGRLQKRKGSDQPVASAAGDRSSHGPLVANDLRRTREELGLLSLVRHSAHQAPVLHGSATGAIVSVGEVTRLLPPKRSSAVPRDGVPARGAKQQLRPEYCIRRFI
jgi:hypothetical protein